VPSAIKHDHELSSRGLVSILVESQGADETGLEGFLWQKFPDNDCFTCVGTSVPIPESRGIPHGAVVGVDGTLLWAGNPLSGTKQIAELVEAELQKVKKGWGDTAEVKKMRAALYGKNDIAGAVAAIAALPDGDHKTKLQGEIDARYAALKNAIAVQKERGYWLAAQEQAKALQKAVGTHPTWAAEMVATVGEFDTDAAKAELALDKKLEKIVKQLRDKKGDAAPKALKALLKDSGESKVAARAQRTLTGLENPAK
jgi:hypothetical protein